MIEPPPEHESGWRSTVARSIALAVVVLDVAWPFIQNQFQLLGHVFNREFVLLAGLTAILCLHDSHAPMLGLRLIPVQGWRYWFRLALLFGAVIAVILVFYFGLWWMMGWSIPVYRYPPRLDLFLFMCVYAPLVEEIVYRALLILAIGQTCGHWGTILVSGVLFALIHVLSGNPSPENQIAGFMLAWALLKSRSILVPLAMHAGGNCFAFASLVAGWCWYSYGQA